jgi:hypothetical protein
MGIGGCRVQMAKNNVFQAHGSIGKRKRKATPKDSTSL